MQEQSIFIEALEKEDPAERAAFLDCVCANDLVLRQRIEKLLKRDQEADGFLESPAGELVAAEGERIQERPGMVIGPYKLIEQIGEGGFGLVFRAEQRHPVRREVAVKVLKPGMDSRQVIARFEAERQALALMDHPNIARVLDAGATASGRPHFVMELVRGVPITDYCEQNGLTHKERLELFVPICEAVQHAHQKGIIHRDIKPSNVLVTLHDGVPVVKVIDFGIAKALGQKLTDKTLCTGFAQMIGTPLYMSPEQAQMSGVDVDTRTDVYSLGVLMYELLTGTTPFDKDRLREAGYDEMRRIIREEDPPRPSTRLSTLGHAPATVSTGRHRNPQRLSQLVRGELDWIVMRALEKDRTRRYETASAFAADVKRYLHDEPVAACPPSAWYLFRKFARRRRGALTMAVVITAALVLVAGSLGWVLRDRAARDAVVVERDLAILSKDRAEEAEQRARIAEKENKIRSHLGQASALRLSREPGRRARALAEIRAAMALAPSTALRHELRNEAIACLAISLDLSPGKEWRGWPTGSVAFDFDGKLERYARSDRQGSITIRRRLDDAEVCPIPGNGEDNWLRLSSDGQFLRSFSDPPWLTRVWKVADKSPSLVFETEASAFDFHPDKPFAAVGEKNDAFKVWDLRQRSSRTYQVGKQVTALAWHPHANRIAVSQPPEVKVYDLDSAQWISTLEINVHTGFRSLAWHPDGRMLAIACDDMSVKFWNIEEENKAKVHALEKLVGGGVAISFNHRGDLLSTTDWGGILKLWDSRTGKQLKTLDWKHNEVPRFSSDDRLIAAGIRENSLQIWEVNTAAEYRTLVRDATVGRSFNNGTIAPEGRLLAVGMEDGVGLWDLKTAAFLGLLPIGVTGGVAFDNSSSPATLITNGPTGVYRWPVQAEPKSSRLRIGPPQKLGLPGSYAQIAVSRDGQIVAQGDVGPGGRLLWPDKDKWISLAHPDARTIAISPDGRWIATGSHNGVGARIWEAGNGKLLHDVMPENPCRAIAFSGDGDWLATLYPSCQLWRVGTWEKALEIQGTQFGFAPDGKILAVETGSSVVRLLDPTSGQEFVRLENPYQELATRIFFSPDGAQLITLGWDAYPIHVWDLRKIRSQLKELDLDWHLPAYPPEGPAWADGPLQLQIDLGSFGQP